ncbi:sirohydrochlorin ferrochelatase [Kineococcus xinjiangensis]|uniref:Sirohydrochlorin ferrochelatase n=1 Tax=Kineococcus xinjiangensis TaxID=512762 RepID=A0A2S6IWJ7_9ACTN|nr:CbiX/SirB N-terminal domain-containing protein [Kineococcus xinjiangensis]PPK98610.1 sirohydrochlorin ferrochelatase [Kineococcus xinjiangensis]
MSGGPPVLVAVSHGTRSPAGRRCIAELRLAIGALRPQVQVRAAHVDVQRPELAPVLASLAAAGRRSVAVPLLLSTGFHVRHDVRAAVEATEGLAVAAAALGPDDALLDVLDDRLAESGAGPDDAVVLAAAGSSSARATRDVEAVVTALAARRGAPVLAGYLSIAQPTVPEAVRLARATGREVSIASYLLAPGVFTERLGQAGADRVCAPLGADPRIAALALARYDAALQQAGWSGVGAAAG